MTQIVNIIVSQQQTPAPSTLQQTAAIVSELGTNLTAGSRSLLTQASDLTPLLVGGMVPIVSIAWASGNVTLTVADIEFPLPAGTTFQVTVTGVTPGAFNGTFNATVVSATQITYPLASNPGTETVLGKVTAELSQLRLINAVSTWFAQGGNNVYVFETGLNQNTAIATSIATVASYITNNPLTVYVWVVPGRWVGTALAALVSQYSSNTGLTYFVTSGQSGTDTAYTVFTGLKAAVYVEEAPTVQEEVALGEVTTAAWAYNMVKYNPSATNMVTPLAFSFIFGVTAYPTIGNGPFLTTLQTQFVNFVSTAAEGGLTNTMITYGTTMDGRDFTYWYSVDWVQINLKLALANEIINGSNNPQAPLIYNQAGINRLQARAQQVMNSAVTFGLATGVITVVATSFADYNAANPNDYAKGIYKGLAVTYTPARGFLSITFNVTVTDFVQA
jgi:hypothetical protein